MSQRSLCTAPDGRRDARPMRAVKGFWMWQKVTVESCPCSRSGRVGFWHWSAVSCWPPSVVEVAMATALFADDDGVLCELLAPVDVERIPGVRRIPSQVLNAPVALVDAAPSFAVFPAEDEPLEDVLQVSLAPRQLWDGGLLGSWYSLGRQLRDGVDGSWYDGFGDHSGVYFFDSPNQDETCHWMWLPFPPRQPATQLPFVLYSMPGQHHPRVSHDA